MTFKQGPSNAMSICCDKDYFAFCEDASGNKLENCQDNLSGIAKRTANGAIDDSKSHLHPLYLVRCYNSYVMQNFKRILCVEDAQQDKNVDSIKAAEQLSTDKILELGIVN